MSTSAPPPTYEATFCVPATHPALPGHFPGHPVVPGVVILDGVLGCAARWLGCAVTVRSLQHAKFLAPLLPEQEALVRLTLVGVSLCFEVDFGGRVLARGAWTLLEAP